jgi:hypothetical protein
VHIDLSEFLEENPYWQFVNKLVCSQLSGSCRQKREDVICCFAFLHFPDGGPSRPDAGKEGQWPGLVEGEPKSGSTSFSEKLVQGTTQRFSIPSQRRQCGDFTLRTLVTPRSELLPFSAKTGEGMPHRAIISSRPSGWFRTIGAE